MRGVASMAPRARRRTALACAALVVAAMAGCAGHAPPKEPELTLPPGISAAPKGLKFSVKITPTTFRLGDSVKLEASMFNNSDQRFERSFPTSCTWDYELSTQDARVLGPERTCDSTPTEIALEPGELRMIVRDWGGRDRYFAARERLEPGRYQVTAGLIDEYHRVIPMADPVTIEILPR